jgi:hypothetical protein
VLKRIWDLSDTGELGVMEKREFFVACKLISLVQSGNANSAELENMNNASPLPRVGSRAAASTDTTAAEPVVGASETARALTTATSATDGSGGDDNPFADLESSTWLLSRRWLAALASV